MLYEPGKGPGILLSLAVKAGTGSREQHQLYSLLASLRKFSGRFGDEDEAHAANGACHFIAQAVVGLLPVACSAARQHAAAADSSSCAAGVCPQPPPPAAAAPEAAAAEAAPAAAGGGSVQALLPSLVLLGHVFLQWADAFEQDINCSYSSRKEQRGPGPKRKDLPGTYWLTASTSVPRTVLEDLAAAVLAWLQAGSVSETLAAAGYKPYHLQQRLQAVTAAVGELVDKQPAGTGEDACLVLPWPAACAEDSIAPGDQPHFEHNLLDELRGLGLALSILATPAFCNNPSCTSVSGGHTELRRMLGRSCVCAGCRVAHYCGRTCQVQHWRQQHKLVCSKLAAAAAAVLQGAGS
jgi:hypothetical protein